jgi:manganese/iron transport system permease protein
MLISPGAFAFLMTRKFSAMLAIAVIVAVISSFLGVYLSFFIDSAPAPTIVLLMTIAFIAAFAFVTSKTAKLQGREAALAAGPNDPGSGQPRI